PEDPEAPDATDADTQPTPSADDVAALEAVTVSGDLGVAPTLDFDQPFTVGAPVARVDVEGDGENLESGRTALIDYVVVSGEDGTVLGSTWDQGTGQTLPIGDPRIYAQINEALAGQQVGTRILFATPPTEGSEATDTAPAVEPTPSVIQ